VATARLTAEQPPALVGKKVNLAQHDLDVLALLLKAGPAPLQSRQEFLEPLVLVARDIVQLEELADPRSRSRGACRAVRA
jgi:hypothetical protein